MSEEHDETLQRFEDGWPSWDAAYVLTLFVAGASELSVRAIATCERCARPTLPGDTDLEVVDIHRDPR